MTEGVVLQFRRQRPQLKVVETIRPKSGLPDFDVLYVRELDGDDWQFGFNHTEDLTTAQMAFRLQMRRNPQSNPGLEGIRYVEFIPLTSQAHNWLFVNRLPRQPRLLAKLAVIELICRLRRAGFVLNRRAV